MIRKAQERKRKQWFGVRILFESNHPEERKVSPLFEEQVILVRARTEAEARKRARQLGRAAQQTYQNVYGKKVRWVLRDILDVVELFDSVLREASEVYFNFLKAREVKQVRRMLH
jgi:uncharacterized protein DUF4288